MGAGSSQPEHEQFLKRAEAAGIIELGEADNPKLPGRKVTTIRLRRNHVVVAQLLLSG
jgi:hypothetical protein